MKGAKNMSEIQNAIEVKNLKKGFGGRVLFENFSLNVKANTIHAIIGPNGSGKTYQNTSDKYAHYVSR